MAWQRTDIRVPVDLDSLGRRIVGQQIVDFIVKRTQKGLDINNEPFPAYSEAYKNSEEFEIADKSNKVDLTLTGDMLSDLQVLSHSVGVITIGYQQGTEENDKAEWHRFPRANTRTGHISPKRDFLGINQKDLDVIVGRYLRSNPVETEIEDRVQQEARSILNRILGQFGGSDV